MNDDRARRRRVDGMLRRHATEDYEIAEIEAADMRDIHDVYVNLREFVERIARGEVRHPVPEARRILGIPVVTTAGVTHFSSSDTGDDISGSRSGEYRSAVQAADIPTILAATTTAADLRSDVCGWLADELECVEVGREGFVCALPLWYADGDAVVVRTGIDDAGRFFATDSSEAQMRVAGERGSAFIDVVGRVICTDLDVTWDREHGRVIEWAPEVSADVAWRVGQASQAIAAAMRVHFASSGGRRDDVSPITAFTTDVVGSLTETDARRAVDRLFQQYGPELEAMQRSHLDAGTHAITGPVHHHEKDH